MFTDGVRSYIGPLFTEYIQYPMPILDLLNEFLYLKCILDADIKEPIKIALHLHFI